MRIPARTILPALLAVGLLAPAAARGDDKDLLATAKARLKVEAERVEKEYKDGRLAAYKLVRRDDPKLVEATEKLTELIAVVEKDTSLSAERRKVILVTLKWDLDNVAAEAAKHRRAADSATQRAAARDARSQAQAGPARRPVTAETKSTTEVAKSILAARGQGVTDARRDRVGNADAHTRAMASVDKAAVPETRSYVLPKDWAEKSARRSAGVKMTAAEKAIMKGLGGTVEVDFNKVTLEDALAQLGKSMKVTITVDKRGLQDVGVSYDSDVTLKLRTSGRTVLKRLLADLNLTYVIKDEAIQVTSRERAKEMTTTRTYYLGDMAAVVDLRLDDVTRALLMVERVNTIIKLITTQIDPQSWKINNPDAAGVIVFDPITMSLIVKQTAEAHFLLGGK